MTTDESNEERVLDINAEEIGRVTDISAEEVTVVLRRDLKSMVRSSFERLIDVGRINSYIIIPSGARRIVAMVTRVFLSEESEVSSDRTMVSLPSSKKRLKATLIGAISGRRFTPGIDSFPAIDSPVLSASGSDREAIFGGRHDDRFRVPIGTAAASPGHKVHIDPDAFFGKHAAIIGSTGAGKSYSVASIIRSTHEKVGSTRFIIFDLNGEYRAAFPKDSRKLRARHISSGKAGAEGLSIPYWFMNSWDFIQLFDLSSGKHAPDFLNSVRHYKKLAVGGTKVVSADAPVFFDKDAFKKKANDKPHDSVPRERMLHFLNEPRYKFLFGPKEHGWDELEESSPKFKGSLSVFLRDILGVEGAGGNTDVQASEEWPSFYLRQRAEDPHEKSRADVVVLDLSLLASEVVESITALIGRLVLEFLQRLGNAENGAHRGAHPVVLVLEEAHNYVRSGSGSGSESVSKKVFDRIAREGRKYGLGLVVASQRPSTLSSTVLSQCNSFIVHRLQNQRDLEGFKETVPSVYKNLLARVPSLTRGQALVLGDCVRAPTLVEMQKVALPPKSDDPEIYERWSKPSEEVDASKFESICKDWEEMEGTETSSDDESLFGWRADPPPSPEGLLRIERRGEGGGRGPGVEAAGGAARHDLLKRDRGRRT